MKLSIVLSIAILSLVSPAQAQQTAQPPSLQLSYQEPIPANGDLASLRAKIMAQIESDCATAAKAFGRQCSINSVNFNEWRMPQPVAGAPTLNATAHVTLTGETPKPEAAQK